MKSQTDTEQPIESALSGRFAPIVASADSIFPLASAYHSGMRGTRAKMVLTTS